MDCEKVGEDIRGPCECGHSPSNHEGCPCGTITRYCFECECEWYKEQSSIRSNISANLTKEKT